MVKPSPRATNLCPRCEVLNFRKVVRTPSIPPHGIEITVIGKAPLRLEQIECPLCRFFFTLAPVYLRRHALHVRLFDHISSTRANEGEAPADTVRQPFLSVLRTNRRLTYNYEIGDEVVQQGLVAYVAGEAVSEPVIYSVGTAVDYDVIKSNLERCHQTHAGCLPTNAIESSFAFISLIDCRTREIVRRPLQEEYFALSYVWGPQALGTHPPRRGSAARFYINEAPLTVQDAVHVVFKLGARYLWVDRYCVDHEDEREKLATIANMDYIYEHAVATIVALYGDCDNSGLPGVSSIFRVPQPRFEHQSGWLISSCPPIATVITQSAWNARGWTYQEARLSRRCLFFSAHQVYVVCREATCSEALPNASSSHSLSLLLNAPRLNEALFGHETSIAPGYFRDRLEYTKRKLTFHEDILNAFRGIMHRSSFNTYWGVPVTMRMAPTTSPEDSFALGHLWMVRPGWTISRHLQSAHSVSSVRRPGFPSWSWTSLVAEIYQENSGEQTLYAKWLQEEPVDLPYNEAQVKFWINVKGSYQPLREVLEKHWSEVTSINQTPGNLLVEGDFIHLTYKYRGDRHRWYNLFGTWTYFQADLCEGQEDRPENPATDDPEETDEALVLVQWNDSLKPNKMQFLLMLLEWTSENHAIRRGLLTRYRTRFDRQAVKSIPRSRRKFYLH